MAALKRTQAPDVGPDAHARVTDALLRTACEQAPGGMTVTSLEGERLWTNDAFCALVGYPAADLVGTPSRRLTHPDDARADAEFMLAARAGQRDRAEGERRLVRERRLDRVGLDPDADHARWRRTRPWLSSPTFTTSPMTTAAQALLRDSERTLRAVIDNTPA